MLEKINFSVIWLPDCMISAPPCPLPDCILLPEPPAVSLIPVAFIS